MTEPCGNLAYPEQTSRRRIEAELGEMTEQQRERARYWLNDYRQKAEQA